MPRSLKKGPYVDPNVLEKMKEIKKGSGKPIRTWSRDCTITPEMLGHIFEVYNGKEFVRVKPTEDMVGHKMGEFSHTTKFDRHGGRMQRDLERKAQEAERQKRKKSKEEK